MVDSQKRWVFLLAALCATIAAIAYPLEEDAAVVEVVTPARATQTAPVDKSEPAPVQGISWIASEADPFEQRSWQAPPPPAPVQQAAAPVAPAAAEAALPPQPLPYKFVGQMNNGDERVVYLSRGEQLLVAHQGEVLEGSYKILAIGQTSIEFEAVSSGIKQSLAIPAQEN